MSDLNESDNFQQKFEKEIPVEIKTDNIENVLKIKSKQFEFSCGIIMAKINQDINTKFGLKWHYDNTENLEGFINSVGNFVAVSGNKITDADKKKLTVQYNSMIKNQE